MTGHRSWPSGGEANFAFSWAGIVAWRRNLENGIYLCTLVTEKSDISGKTNEVKFASLGLAPRNLAYACRYAV